MSFNEGVERDDAIRVARVVAEYTALDATRDLARLFVHVEQARQDMEHRLLSDQTFGTSGSPAIHLTAECDVCRRAAVWLKILTGAVG
jgi:hypothetical protein